MGDRGGRRMNDLYRKVRDAEVESYPTGRKSWVPIYERVEPDYYEVETDGTSLSGPRFRVVPERPVGPIYGYSPEPLKRYAVYRVRLTDGEADDE